MSADLSIAARLIPASFPHPVQQLQLRETAISWIVLTGQYVYKIKKPVHLEFLDASTLSRRHFLCQEELRLNRRFAPEIYLEVVAIGEQRDRLVVGAAGVPIEYAVRMRQFERRQELAQRLTDGVVHGAELARLGEHLAQWHEAAAEARGQDFGTPELVRAQVLENFTALRGQTRPPDAEALQRLAAWSTRQLDRLGGLIGQRVQGGRVREGHGDLHAGNVVCWRGQWLPFDCLEFEPRLRWIDVMSDVAFLYMDLISRARCDLACAFLGGYLERAGDYAGLPLLAFFAVYRALVRAKVDALAQDRKRLHQRLETAERLTQQQRPALILMHGVSGSGKSWLSSRLRSALGAVRVRSDLERRRLFGAGAYSAAADDATHERLLECAVSALAAGLRVIVDATFLQAARRRPFVQRAQQQGYPLLLIDCRAPQSLLEERIAQRHREAEDPSEATVEVLRAQLAAAEAFEPEERSVLLRIDTSAPDALERTVAQVRARLEPGVR